MKKINFTNELSDSAMNVYSTSSFTFYKENNEYYVAYNENETPAYLGSLEDVEAFLMEFTRRKNNG